jgi:hypothetical protein
MPHLAAYQNLNDYAKVIVLGATSCLLLHCLPK